MNGTDDFPAIFGTTLAFHPPQRAQFDSGIIHSKFFTCPDILQSDIGYTSPYPQVRIAGMIKESKRIIFPGIEVEIPTDTHPIRPDQGIGLVFYNKIDALTLGDKGDFSLFQTSFRECPLAVNMAFRKMGLPRHVKKMIQEKVPGVELRAPP